MVVNVHGVHRTASDSNDRLANLIMQQGGARKMLTKYECSRIIGIRASQIGMSAPILIDVPKTKQDNFHYIAAMELRAGVLDVVIRRPLPMSKYYEVHLRDLKLPDDLDSLLSIYE